MTIIRDDITGQRFGRLIAVEFAGIAKGRSSLWRCRCACGSESVVRLTALRNGHTTSCGCLRVERVSAATAKHGRSKTPTYQIWADMRRRCHNHNSQDFHRYGGRGISICERWNDYAMFLLDMGEQPEGLTLGRINNDGPYSPENCRWETRTQQQRNTVRNRVYELNGIRKCASEWENELGLSRGGLWQRLNKRGWPLEKALTTKASGR